MSSGPFSHDAAIYYTILIVRRERRRWNYWDVSGDKDGSKSKRWLVRPRHQVHESFPNLDHRKTQGVDTILDQITANFLTFHHASLFARLVIDLCIWLPLNYETIFPFLLEIYL